MDKDVVFLKEASVMKTIQITIDEALLERVDQATQQLNMSRSSAVRAALAQWLHERHMEELDRLTEEGYRRAPARPDEFRSEPSQRARGDDWPWEDA